MKLSEPKCDRFLSASRIAQMGLVAGCPAIYLAGRLPAHSIFMTEALAVLAFFFGGALLVAFFPFDVVGKGRILPPHNSFGGAYALIVAAILCNLVAASFAPPLRYPVFLSIVLLAFSFFRICWKSDLVFLTVVMGSGIVALSKISLFNIGASVFYSSFLCLLFIDDPPLKTHAYPSSQSDFGEGVFSHLRTIFKCLLLLVPIAVLLFLVAQSNVGSSAAQTSPAKTDAPINPMAFAIIALLSVAISILYFWKRKRKVSMRPPGSGLVNSEFVGVQELSNGEFSSPSRDTQRARVISHFLRLLVELEVHGFSYLPHKTPREFSQLVIGRGSADSRIFVEINAILYRARYSQTPVLKEDALRMGMHVDNVIQDLDKAAL